MMGRPVGYILNRTLEKHKKIDELYAQGKLATEIADIIHMTHQAVGIYFKSKGYALQKRIRKLDESVFDDVATEEQAYWLGFLCADCALVCGNGNGKKRYGVELTLSDKEHVEKFANFMKSNSPVKEKQVKLKDKIHIAYRFYASSKHLAETLTCSFGETKKSKRIKLPHVAPQLQRHMLRGFFDGDGAVINGHSLTLEISSSIPLVIDFAKMLHFEERIKGVSKNQARFRLHGKAAESVLRYMYDNSCIYLERKYERYAHYFSNEVVHNPE